MSVAWACNLSVGPIASQKQNAREEYCSRAAHYTILLHAIKVHETRQTPNSTAGAQLICISELLKSEILSLVSGEFHELWWHAIVSFSVRSYCISKLVKSKISVHSYVAQTTDAQWSLCSLKPQFWGIFGQTISTHFGTVSPLSMFSTLQLPFLQKTKPLYPHSTSQTSIWDWDLNLNLGRKSIRDLAFLCL